MERANLISDLRKNLVECLNLEGVGDDELAPSTPLFGDGGLGLDSVDALEIVVMLEKKYGIVVDSGVNSKEAFYSIEKLADFVAERAK